MIWNYSNGYYLSKLTHLAPIDLDDIITCSILRSTPRTSRRTFGAGTAGLETVGPFLERGERKEVFVTVSNHEINRLYGPEDITDLDYDEDLGFPGELPYTRRPYVTMYRGRMGTIRQFAGFDTSEEINERFHYLIDESQLGLSIAFDTSTLMGIDSDVTM